MSLELFLLLCGIGLIVGGFFVPGIIGLLMLIVGGACIGFVAGEINIVSSLWGP